MGRADGPMGIRSQQYDKTGFGLSHTSHRKSSAKRARAPRSCSSPFSRTTCWRPRPSTRKRPTSCFRRSPPITLFSPRHPCRAVPDRLAVATVLAGVAMVTVVTCVRAPLGYFLRSRALPPPLASFITMNLKRNFSPAPEINFYDIAEASDVADWFAWVRSYRRWP